MNNKINPRNGLGQPISVGDIFDLYQHYTDQFKPNDMFSNILARNAVEYEVWTRSRPVFERITQLMNNSYAYKNKGLYDAQGKSIQSDDFTLPKFIYLLGHDLIDVRQPEQTSARIEIANRYGIGAVKTMQTMLADGQSLEAVLAKYPVNTLALPQSSPTSKPATKELAPDTRVLAASVAREETQSTRSTPASAEFAVPL